MSQQLNNIIYIKSDADLKHNILMCNCIINILTCNYRALLLYAFKLIDSFCLQYEDFYHQQKLLLPSAD